MLLFGLFICLFVIAQGLPIFDTNNHFYGIGAQSMPYTLGDYNRDGLTDLFVVGNVYSRTYLYRQNSDHSFTNVFDGYGSQLGFDNTYMFTMTQCAFLKYQGNVRWLLITGTYDINFGSTKYANFLYEYDYDTDTFTNSTDSTHFNGDILLGNNGVIVVGDYDMDGNDDFYISGTSPSNSYYTVVYHQNMNGTFTNVYNNVTFPDTLPPYFQSFYRDAVSFVDYDGNGLKDLVGFASIRYPSGFTIPGYRFYRQNTVGVFNDVSSIALPSGIPESNYLYVSCGWGDYNNDNLLDFIYSGLNTSYTGGVFILFIQTSNGTFTANSNSSIFPEGNPIGIIHGSIVFADFTNDGKLDIIVSGFIDFSRTISISYFMIQQPNNTFIVSTGNNTFPNGLYQTGWSDIRPNDYNNDGLLDFFFKGKNDFLLYRNACPLESYWNGTICSSCAGITDIERLTCQPCANNSYYIGNNTCSPCVNNTVVAPDLLSCQACPNNTYFYGGNTTCLYCDSGLIINSDQTGCIVNVTTGTSSGDGTTGTSSGDGTTGNMSGSFGSSASMLGWILTF